MFSHTHRLKQRSNFQSSKFLVQEHLLWKIYQKSSSWEDTAGRTGVIFRILEGT